MRLYVLTIGRLRDPAVTALVEEYVRRSRPFVPIERAEAKDVATAWERAERLAGPVVLLDERGEPCTSPELAAWIGLVRDRGERALTFLIGDADGFSAEDRQRANRVLSLSRMTLPHRLAVVIVCEQLYRAGTLLAGHPYHHG